MIDVRKVDAGEICDAYLEAVRVVGVGRSGGWLLLLAHIFYFSITNL